MKSIDFGDIFFKNTNIDILEIYERCGYVNTDI